MKWLIYGADGWIGGQVCDILIRMSETVVKAKMRADNETDVAFEIANTKPDRVISLIGRTSGAGYASIDYLEQPGKLVENIRDNLYGPLTLAMLCRENGIHFTYLGTGCIFNGYNNGKGYAESDEPDFFGSAYSTVKGFTDKIMHSFVDCVLNVRIRMPITADKSPKNFITKIMSYDKICSQYNSMTVLPELLPVMIDMAKRGLNGTINLTNPGVISHNEILEMVKEIIDPDFTWQNFSLEEQDKILLSKRSNNMLNTDNLKALYPDVMSIIDAVRKILYQMRDNL